LSSSLLSKNLQIKVHRTEILVSHIKEKTLAEEFRAFAVEKYTLAEEGGEQKCKLQKQAKWKFS
jgi:hypothetical protein